MPRSKHGRFIFHELSCLPRLPTWTLTDMQKVQGKVRGLIEHSRFSMARGREAHFPLRLPTLTRAELQRTILEKLDVELRAWLTLLIFYGPGEGSTFPTQVPNPNPNKTAKDHFGKVGGRVWSLNGHCWSFMARGEEAHFPIRFPTWTPTELQRTILENLGVGSGAWLDIVDFLWPGEGKHIFHSGCQPEP